VTIHRNIVKVLSIAGSDPSGGAGIQADLKTFTILGAFGMAVPAAITIQNSRGVAGVYDISPRAIQQQLETLVSDIRPDAIKTGMLLTRQTVNVVARVIRKFRVIKLVIDPVIRSSSGKPLLRPDAIQALTRSLFPLATVITPNIPEAEMLSGMRIRSAPDMDFAAGILLDKGPAYVLIKGGHGRGPAVDTLYGGKTVLSFSTSRKKGEFHGTGCMLSSAIAVFIARGFPVEKAVEKAKQVVDTMLKTARPVGKSTINYFQF
jgi:hydroxymethylpyrimidine kinase/phosphomethylpyrimidine kinase